MRIKYPFVSHLAALLLPRSETGKTRRHHGAMAPQRFRSCRVLRAFACTFLYVNKRGKQKNSANYTQTLHFALYFADYPRVAKCIVCGANYTQTIHKLYTNPTLRVKETKSQKVKETKRERDGGRIALQANLSLPPTMRVCQSAHFGFTLEGASEWLRCKALRMRAQGVY